MSTKTDSPLTIKQRLAAAAISLKTGEDLQSRLTELTQLHTDATTEIQRLTDALKASEALAATRLTEISTHVQTISNLTQERNELKTKVEQLPAQVAAGVTEKVAELGFPASQMPKSDVKAVLDAPKTLAEAAAAVEAETDPVKRKALFVIYEQMERGEVAAARN